MRKVKVADLDQYYSLKGKPDTHDKFTELWMVDIQEDHLSGNEVLGLSQRLLESAEDLSQGWTGWGFYTHKTINSRYSSIPVLLFEDQEDAVFARMHWPASGWLNRLD